MKNEWIYPEKVIKIMRKDYNDLDINRLAIGLVKPNSKVLSVGCGAGREVKYLRSIGCDITAVDKNKEFISSSMKIEFNAKYIHGNVLDINLKDRFDYIIILYNTINAFDSKDKRKKLIERCNDWCNKGGKIIIVYKSVYGSYKYLIYFWLKQSYYCIFPFEVNYWFENTDFKWEQIKYNNARLLVGKKE